MPDLLDGESVEVQGSSGAKYVLKNIAGVYSCSCPAWRNQSANIDKRTCKHLRSRLGEQAERERLGNSANLVSTPKTNKDVVALSLLLAKNWDGSQDISSWFLSEKLDGVRGYWDGLQFLSRNGHTYHAPAWFTKELPRIPLDGELWIARKSFQRTVSVVRRQNGGDLWREIRFVIFDAPTIFEPFEERFRELHRLFPTGAHEFATVLPQMECRSLDHLREALTRVESLGGEGIMLRQPGSRYEHGRSTTLLKVKTFHDAEATVIAHLPGTGRHKGRLGALLVELPSGTYFSVGSGFTDRQREHPPALGSVITFRYQEITAAGLPRFPTFVRERVDQPTLPVATR
jgi:DNA ligase 1